jgi:predicted esterase
MISEQGRVGALGFGAGALAAVGIVVGKDSDAFARALLYPGCAMLHLGFAQEPSATRLTGPVLLLHGEADPTNAPEECAASSRNCPPRRRSWT